MARNRTNLLARYPNLAANPALVVGDYDGNLANDGERVALARPEIAINADDPQNVTTNIIYVVVDEVEYRDGGSWGHWSDGGGSSLELIDSRADNRLAPNWADSDETSKAPWSTIEHTGVLDNGGDTADHLHVIMLEEGECLVDDVEVIPQGAVNRISNSTFETGLTGWTARGDHERSSLANVGYNSSRSLHVRASARGDIGAEQNSRTLHQCARCRSNRHHPRESALAARLAGDSVSRARELPRSHRPHDVAGESRNAGSNQQPGGGQRGSGHHRGDARACGASGKPSDRRFRARFRHRWRSIGPYAEIPDRSGARI